MMQTEWNVSDKSGAERKAHEVVKVFNPITELTGRFPFMLMKNETGFDFPRIFVASFSL